MRAAAFKQINQMGIIDAPKPSAGASEVIPIPYWHACSGARAKVLVEFPH